MKRPINIYRRYRSHYKWIDPTSAIMAVSLAMSSAQLSKVKSVPINTDYGFNSRKDKMLACANVVVTAYEAAIKIAHKSRIIRFKNTKRYVK